MPNYSKDFDEIAATIVALISQEKNKDALYQFEKLRDVVDMMVYEAYKDGVAEGVDQERKYNSYE